MPIEYHVDPVHNVIIVSNGCCNVNCINNVTP
uniref:Uncharacterized protein n=1 Tax=Setaria italica TaxID=4555 RepID=K3ZPJ4_SETIT